MDESPTPDRDMIQHIRPHAQADSGFNEAVSHRIREILYQRASDRATSARWNVSSLILIYILFITVVLLTLFGVHNFLVATISVLGLMAFWLVSWLRSKRLEKRFFEQELSYYQEMLSGIAETGSAVRAEETSIDTDSPLTPRELEVLENAVNGKTNKEIGKSLGIAEETVKNHFMHIFMKLNVNDRTSAVVIALRNRWVKL